MITVAFGAVIGILSGYIGVFYTRWPKEAFFALLTGLGLAAGLAIWAFNKPLKKAVGNT